MFRPCLWIVVFAFLCPLPSHAQTASSRTAAAETSAAKWLALVDTENYGASWDETASTFRVRISREQWSQMVRAARTPFGLLQKRTLKSASAVTSLPGAPDGEYVVMQFDATFEHKAAAVETVTMARDADQNWRAVGYFIR